MDIKGKDPLIFPLSERNLCLIKQYTLHLLICESWLLLQSTLLKIPHKIKIRPPSLSLEIFEHLLLLSARLYKLGKEGKVK